ncbi:Ferripyoverdine receptor [compost metagenome]
MNWQSEFYGKVYSPTVGDYTKLEQESYALVDLMARYQFSDNLSATLNAKNIFDKKYLTGMGYFDTGFYGEPRSLSLTTKWDF